MKHNPTGWLVLLGPVFFFSLFGLALAQKQPAANESTTVAWKAPAGNPQDFVGAAVCADCHVTQPDLVAGTPHAKGPADAAYGTGCESCHGPGKAHVEAEQNATDAEAVEAGKRLIFAFNGSPSDNSRQCLTCHNTSQDQQHFARSEHSLNGVACQSCHSAHLQANQTELVKKLPQQHFFGDGRPGKTEEQRWLTNSLLRASQPQLCYSCHGTVKAQFLLPSHHRVPEGQMKCTDCHNTHGTRNQPMLKKTNWEGCIGCHSEKRGPFVFEHAAVKVEGCVGCHTPHGSVSRNLLLRREGRFLCLQCHVDPQAPNVPHGRLGFTTRGECIRCHVTVHGSNHSEFFLD